MLEKCASARVRELGAPHSDGTSLSLLGYVRLKLGDIRIASTGVAADIRNATKFLRSLWINKTTKEEAYQLLICANLCNLWIKNHDMSRRTTGCPVTFIHYPRDQAVS